MKDTSSLHLKIQEFCDCYKATDFLTEMAKLGAETDKDEAALKWLALATLHGINANAKRIAISRSKDGAVTVTAKYRETELPSPGAAIGDRIIKAVRDVTHLEGDKGSTPFAMGVNDDSVELKVKVAAENGGETVTLKF